MTAWALHGWGVEAVAQGVSDGVGATARTDLGIEVHQVALDRRHGNAKAGRDFFVRRAIRNLPQHLNLPRREGVETRRGNCFNGPTRYCGRRCAAPQKPIDCRDVFVVDSAGERIVFDDEELGVRNSSSDFLAQFERPERKRRFVSHECGRRYARKEIADVDPRSRGGER